MDNYTPMSDKEERILSALAHGSIVAQGLGILVGVVLYVTQRDRSERVAFQALQAAVYQFVSLLVTVGLWMAWLVFHGISYIPLFQNPEAFEENPPTFFFITLAAMVVPLALTMVWWLYGLLGALQTLRGRKFRYAVIGRLLDREDVRA
jgi:uncharacterized Tic20 family protein